MNDLTEEEAKQVVDRCQTDPIFHIEEIQGCTTLEPYQKKIVEAIRDNERVAVSACHDVGKTFLMSKIVLWFTSIFPDCKVITTAPTDRQVELLLWSEIRAGFRKSKYPLGGKMQTKKWSLSEEWYAVGFSPPKKGSENGGQGSESSFQGFHARYILVVFDEATGIPKQIWDQAEGMLTSGHVRFVAIANPTSRASEFFKCFKDPFWVKIYLSFLDSPNMAANNIHSIEDLVEEINLVKSMNDTDAMARFKTYKTVQPKLLSLSWVVSRGIRWGIGHPLFVSKVIGKFPEEDDNVMIPLSVVEESQYRHEEHKNKKSPVIVRSIGVDPARFGPDSTVITVLEDEYQVLRKKLPKGRTTEIVNFLVNLLKTSTRCKKEVVLIDGTGLGAGVVDGLIQAKQIVENSFLRNVSVREIHYGAQCEDPEDKEEFFNLKAKIFKCLADSLKKDLAILPENIYLEELPTIVYGFTPKGQLIIESKDDYKKRTRLGSPDDSDSLSLANFGRIDTGRVGDFGDSFTKQRPSRTLSPGLKSGDQW